MAFTIQSCFPQSLAGLSRFLSTSLPTSSAPAPSSTPPASSEEEEYGIERVRSNVSDATAPSDGQSTVLLAVGPLSFGCCADPVHELEVLRELGPPPALRALTPATFDQIVILLAEYVEQNPFYGCGGSWCETIYWCVPFGPLQWSLCFVSPTTCALYSDQAEAKAQLQTDVNVVRSPPCLSRASRSNYTSPSCSRRTASSRRRSPSQTCSRSTSSTKRSWRG